MIKKLISAVTTMALATTFVGQAVPVQAAPPVKVTICHATNSVNHPYNQLSVKKSSIDNGGGNDHSQHVGPVVTTEAQAQALKDAHNDWGDIIPPFAGYAGLNWTATGQNVYNNGCVYVATVTPGTTDNEDPGTTDGQTLGAVDNLPYTAGENLLSTPATMMMGLGVLSILSLVVKAAYVRFF